MSLVVPANAIDRARRLVVGSEGSLSVRARRRRGQLLLEWFPDLAELHVLDIGGTPHSWRFSPVLPRTITLVNPQTAFASTLAPRFEHVVGDACALPDAIGGRRFDLVFSNSVIEHVGGAARRQAMAEEIRRLDAPYWVQTPNRGFPIEPHFMFPGFQWLPLRARTALIRRWPLPQARNRRREHGAAVELALSVDLVSATEMHWLFPDAQLLREPFAGLTKSLIAVRR